MSVSCSVAILPLRKNAGSVDLCWNFSRLVRRCADGLGMCGLWLELASINGGVDREQITMAKSQSKRIANDHGSALRHGRSQQRRSLAKLFKLSDLLLSWLLLVLQATPSGQTAGKKLMSIVGCIPSMAS